MPARVWRLKSRGFRGRGLCANESAPQIMKTTTPLIMNAHPPHPTPPALYNGTLLGAFIIREGASLLGEETTLTCLSKVMD